MKLSYESHFSSHRPDGRLTSSLAAHMERLRHHKPILSLPETEDPAAFSAWQTAVKEKLTELLRMPPVTPQPAPVRLSRTEREGYAVEKWELYPDDYTVVPFLMLIPHTATTDHPAPLVLCIPGSNHSKELLAGEPLLDRGACQCNRMPERNCMAKHYVQNGMIAVAFDNPETAECCIDPGDGSDVTWTSRVGMCFGYIQSGLCYAGMSLFQKLRCLDFLLTLPFVDKERIASSGHSLGSLPALYLGLLRDEVKAVVFNDFVCDPRERFMCMTEEESTNIWLNAGNWHEMPELWHWFGHQDLLAALAPKYLTTNEGGGETYLATVRRAYALAGTEDRFQVSHYPKYQDPSSRTHHGPLPAYGLSMEDHFEHCAVEPEDHSFRAEPSLRLLKRVFFGD